MSAAIEDVSTTEGLPDPSETSGADPHEEANEAQSEPTLQERIRSDGDFAWEQTIKRDSKISELQNRVKQYETIDPYIRAAGSPDNLLNLAAFGQQVEQVPGLKEFVQESLRSGRVALPEAAKADDPSDEWIDEDTKKVRDELRSEIAGMKEQLQGLSGLANSASIRSQEAHVRRNIDQVADLFESSPAGREEVLSLIEQRVSVAQSQAEAGNVQQQKMIDQLAGPEGADVLRFLLMKEGLFDKYGPEIYGQKKTQTNGEESAAVVRTTDGRTVNPSRPGAPSLPPLPKGRAPNSQFAEMVFREVARRRGRSV